MQLSSSLLLSCTLFTVAEAVNGATHISDQYVEAQIGVNSVFSLFYLILFGLCIVVLVRFPMLRNRVYLTLLLTLLSQAINTIFAVFGAAIDFGGLVPNTNASYGPINIAFSALSDFFYYWAYALLFLCICLLVHERHLAMRPLSTIIPTTYFTLFALLMVFGITTTGLSIDYDRFLFDPVLLRGHTFSELNSKGSLALDLEYTFDSIWYLASACLVGYSIYAYQQMRRSSLHDKVMRFVLVTIMPLYILLNVESMMFTIINSPAGLKYKSDPIASLHQYEGVHVAQNVLSNGFFVAVSSAILALGLSGGRLGTEQGEGSVCLGVYEGKMLRAGDRGDSLMGAET